MERFKLKNGILLPPPRNGVAADGRVISNFDRLVSENAVFAAQNGYFPKEKEEAAPREGEWERVWCLIQNVWCSSFVPVEVEARGEDQM